MSPKVRYLLTAYTAPLALTAASPPPIEMCRARGPLVEFHQLHEFRRQAPTGRHANPTLVGGSDDEAADASLCRQENLRRHLAHRTHVERGKVGVEGFAVGRRRPGGGRRSPP